MGSTGTNTQGYVIQMTDGGLYGVWVGDTLLTTYHDIDVAKKNAVNVYNAWKHKQSIKYTYDDIKKTTQTSGKYGKNSGKLSIKQSTKTVWAVGGKTFPTLKSAKAWVDNHSK